MLGIINTVLLTFFFYRLSGVTPELYLASVPYGGTSFWVDYLILIIIPTFMPVYLHYIRYEFQSDVEKNFNIHGLQSKIVMILGCDVLPTLLLSGMLVGITRWLS